MNEWNEICAVELFAEMKLFFLGILPFFAFAWKNEVDGENFI